MFLSPLVACLRKLAGESKNACFRHSEWKIANIIKARARLREEWPISALLAYIFR
jgi:hypothetical protein